MTKCFDRKKNQLPDTVPTAFNSVDYQPSYVVDARRGPTAPKSVKEPTGPEKETGRGTSTGAVFTSAEKRTSTGRSSPFPTKDLESEPRR